MSEVRIAVRVRPGASRTLVAGRHGEGELVVAVTAPPVDGAANEAVERAVAEALGVRPRQVSVAHGHTARSKVLVIRTDDPDTVAAAVERLLDLERD